MVLRTEAASVLRVVGVESEVYEGASVSGVVVCDCGPLHASVDHAYDVACEDGVSEAVVSWGVVDAVGYPGCPGFPFVGGASSAWPVEEFGTAGDVADSHG